jgi:endonuclease/exonuclease/phosphatase family metal-dependent hydrolase
MAPDAGAKGQQAIDDHAELNRIVAQPVYSAADKARLIELEAHHGFAAARPPRAPLLVLNKLRGQLYSRSRAGVVTIKASGRDDWIGWFELRRDDIRWQATVNTARVIAEVNPDILICVEAENRPALLRFNEQILGPLFRCQFPHVMLVDGNDDRGIDVALMSRYPIIGVRPHVDDRNTNGSRTFSRDCPEYVVQLPGGRSVVVIPNHFKSKFGGNDRASQARRKSQAAAAAAIATRALEISPWVLLGGDLNDTPDSPAIAPLWQTGFVDVQSHPSYPTQRPGTFARGTARDKIDYLLMSPRLREHLQATGIERRGSYHPKLWKPFDTVTQAAVEASDHHLVWADFEF